MGHVKLWEILIMAIGLSMDAFAVSICKGLSVRKATLRQCVTAGVWFGGFQAIMPVIGYYVGRSFSSLIKNYDHWVAFALLLLIGANMIKGSLSNSEGELNDSFGFKAMLILAIATSIDALAVGVTLSFLNADIWSSVLIIGVTTFIFSAGGVRIGNVFGAKYKSKSELAGGIILILIGIKIIFEHLKII